MFVAVAVSIMSDAKVALRSVIAAALNIDAAGAGLREVRVLEAVHDVEPARPRLERRLQVERPRLRPVHAAAGVRGAEPRKKSREQFEKAK